MFQVISLTFATEQGPKEVEFIGPTPFTQEEWNKIANKPLNQLITGFKISLPIHIKDVPGDYDALIHSAAEDETN